LSIGTSPRGARRRQPAGNSDAHGAVEIDGSIRDSSFEATRVDGLIDCFDNIATHEANTHTLGRAVKKSAADFLDPPRQNAIR
jgi:hypothetical protein